MSEQRPGGAPEVADPGGALVLVATPIGNLGDLAPRAVEVLRTAVVICCEDTRRTRTLLSAFEIPAGDRLLSLHEHNEVGRIDQIVHAVATGNVVAVVSDAGMPGVSDPGELLVRAVIDSGLPVTVVPGASAVLGALVVSGLATDRFAFDGFLPRRGPERRARLAEMACQPRTIVFFESPRRVAGTLDELGELLEPDRKVVVVRELTKVFEEVWRGTVAEARGAFAGRELKGEVVIVLEGAPERAEEPPNDDELASYLSECIANGMSRRDAARDAAEVFSVPKRRAYEIAQGLNQPSQAD
jgi:16S rRNA (cytidine1402-2'-O)-methyltransferase